MGGRFRSEMIRAILELIEKLATLIPPPRLNLVRYHGILALMLDPPSPTVSAPPEDALAAPLVPIVSPGRRSRCHRLLGGGRLRLIAALTEPVSVRPFCTGSACRSSSRRLSRLERPTPARLGFRRITLYSTLHCPPSLLVGRRTASKSA